jgi:hypothetical protein
MSLDPDLFEDIKEIVAREIEYQQAVFESLFREIEKERGEKAIGA